MIRFIFTGTKEEILDRLLQHLIKNYPFAALDFQVIEFFNIEIFTFLEDNGFKVESLCFSTPNHQFVFSYNIFYTEDSIMLRERFYKFFQESGLSAITNDVVFTSDYSFEIKYNVTYLDEPISMRRFFLIQDYWRIKVMEYSK